MWFIFFLTLQGFFPLFRHGRRLLYLCFSSLPHCHWQSFADFPALGCFCHEHLFPFEKPDTRSIFRCLWGSFFQCNTSWQISVGVSETSPVSLCFIIPYSFNHCNFLRVWYSWMRFFINIIQPCKIVYVYFFLRCQWSKRRHLHWKPHTLLRKLQWLLYTWKMWIHLFHSEGFLPVSPACLQNVLEIAVKLNRNALYT